MIRIETLSDFLLPPIEDTFGLRGMNLELVQKGGRVFLLAKIPMELDPKNLMTTALGCIDYVVDGIKNSPFVKEHTRLLEAQIKEMEMQIKELEAVLKTIHGEVYD